MSVPGYAYPAFDYSRSELLTTSPLTVVAGAADVAAGFLGSVVAQADEGGSIFLREVGCFVNTSAVVGNRTVALQLDNQDSALEFRYTSPVAMAANDSRPHQWSVGFSAAYVAGGNGYSPMGALVIPTGWKWLLLILGPQLGDSIQFANGSGIFFPPVTEQADITPTVVPTLLT